MNNYQNTLIETAPLSLSQKRLFFIYKLKPNNTAYNIFRSIHFQGNFCKDSFVKALNEIIKRHGSLRTKFMEDNGEYYQIISPFINRIPEIVNLENEPTEKQEEIFKQKTKEDSRTPFNLLSDELFRFKLYKFSSTNYFFTICFHHIITDGWSMQIFYSELSSLYNTYLNNSGSILEDLPIQYIDFATQQQYSSHLKANNDQLFYWKRKLNQAPSVNQLPLDFSRTDKPEHKGEKVKFEIPLELTASLKELCKSSSVTLNVLLLSAYSVLISKYSQVNDIIIGSPNAARNHKDIESLIGFFVSTLPLRIITQPKATFAELLNDVKNTLIEAMDNQDVLFEQIVEEIQPERSLNYSPIFQIMFAYHNFPKRRLNFAGMKTNIIETEKTSIEVDLELHINNNDTGGLSGYFFYNKSIFRRETIDNMASHFVNLLENITINFNKKVHEIDILSETERNKILYEFNETKIDYPSEGIIELFEEQVRKNPEQIAIKIDNKQITYKRLNNLANQIAQQVFEKGITDNQNIAMLFAPSIQMIACMLGILKAGCAYVPLATEAPNARNKHIISDCNASLLFIQEYLYNENRNSNLIAENKLISVSEEISFNDELLFSNKAPLQENIAYVIYTSGTSGQPKGVEVKHKGVLNFINWRISNYGFNSSDKTLQLLSYHFDGFGSNMYPTLLTGGTLFLVSDIDRLNANYIADKTINEGITNSVLTPGIYELLLSKLEHLSDKSHLRFITLAGEKASKSLLEKSENILPEVTIYNEYGPTETSIGATCYKELTSTNTAIIGKPVSNTSVYILSKNNELLPIGISGELCISGKGVAKGYINTPMLTKEKFNEHPFISGEKIYRTGDLARWLPDGNIEISGRIDNQVKLRGYRIELEEIEKRLTNFPAIKNATVIIKGSLYNNKTLVAYYTSNTVIQKQILKEHLSISLPAYMLPDYFIRLEELPLNTRGKIDKKRLPELPENLLNKDSHNTEPVNSLESKIKKIWEEVLNLKNIGVNDSFFDIGGHSLLLTKVVDQIKGNINIEIDLMDLFRFPTIRKISDFCSKRDTVKNTLKSGSSKAESLNIYIKAKSRNRN